jgi:poly(3-hydroxybutyrate) depolymerase
MLITVALVASACSSADMPSSASGGSQGPGGAPGGAGTTGTGGAAQTGGQTGAAGSKGGSGGMGATSSGGTTGAAGATGGVTGAAGVSGAAGADGLAGASGATGIAGSGAAGRGGSGGAVAGKGGGSGPGGEGGRGGAAGGTAGSGGTGTAMRSPGCGKAATLTSGSRTIQSSSQSRSYILRIPDNYDNSHPYRLIFAYHWNGGTMQDIDGGGTSGAAWSYYGLKAQANNSTIFVAPQGIGNGWGNSGGQDLKLTDDMIKLIEGDLCVDTTQVFALGFSYGGSMSYALACARPTVFRAVAVYSGGVLSGCDGGTQPVAYLGIHGIGDGTLNISGGRSMRDKFVTNNGCTAQSPPEPKSGSGTHTCTPYQGCKPGYPVEWCAFDGGHTPGNVDGGGDDGAKTWTKGEVWKFFTQFQ